MKASRGAVTSVTRGNSKLGGQKKELGEERKGKETQEWISCLSLIFPKTKPFR